MIETIPAWHKFVASRDPVDLKVLLAESVVFHSPVVYKPQPGKSLTMGYLLAAVAVLGNDSFRYLRESLESVTQRWNSARSLTASKSMA